MVSLQAACESPAEGCEVRANELLLWLSARRHGSWQQFRGAVEELHMEAEPASADDLEGTDGGTDGGTEAAGLPIYQILRLNLARLAHVEFFAGGCEAGWRTAPPVLATHAKDGAWSGVLCGARSDALLSRLMDSARESVSLSISRQDGGPDLIETGSCRHQDIEKVAGQAGVLLQANAPLSLMAVLPAVDDLSNLHRKELPFGTEWRFERFSVTQLAWRPSAREEAIAVQQGLFRCRFRYIREHYLCRRGDSYLAGGQIGKFAVLRRQRRVLSYDPASRELSFSAICRPPLLIERALILCSGILPSFDPAASLLTYTNIPPGMAHLAAQLLRQEVLPAR